MDFSVIFKLRTKKYWWMDVIFYFVISVLIATILCYIIFLIKNNLLRKDIEKEIAALETVGTAQQKQQESDVISYQKKIIGFTELFKNHEFASNTFAFLQTQTLPSVWFKQFNLDKKNSSVQLSGESENAENLSRQVSGFEKNKYVSSIETLNSALGASARNEFNINLKLDKSIFGYLTEMSDVFKTSGVIPEKIVEETPKEATENQGQSTEPESTGAKSGEKMITAFHLLLTPEVIGTIDETNHFITLNVPYGTDVLNLIPSIIVSTGATVLPASNAPQNFTEPLAYMVTAEDGSIQSYKVTVNVLPQVVVQESSKSKLGVWIAIIIVFVVAVISGVAFFIWRKKRRSKTI